MNFLYGRVYGMDLGKDVRISMGAKLDKTHPEGIHIGDYTAITSGAAILTHDFVNRTHRDLHIGRNCFIGYGAIILPGVRIGDSGDRLHFLGREGGLINVDGVKIYPETVEDAVKSAPGVALVQVSSKKNPITGTLVVAEVQFGLGADADATKQAVLATCRARLVREAVRRALAGGWWLAHATRLTAWIRDVNPRRSEFCNNAALPFISSIAACPGDSHEV